MGCELNAADRARVQRRRKEEGRGGKSASALDTAGKAQQ